MYTRVYKPAYLLHTHNPYFLTFIYYYILSLHLSNQANIKHVRQSHQYYINTLFKGRYLRYGHVKHS